MTKRLQAGRLQAIEDGERGSALLVVIVLLGLIAVLASVVARSVSGAAVTLGAARTVWQSEADLRTGIELGAATILKLGEDMRSAETSIVLAGRRIEVRVTNERARIDLNAAAPALLASMLKSVGLLEGEAAALAAGVAEWRADAATEAIAARQVQPTPGSARRHFLHPGQLASVPGFPASLLEALLPLVTVASGAGQIDPFIANGSVLMALPNTSAGSVEAFLGARDGNSGRETAVLLLGVETSLVTAEAAPGWRIEVSSRTENGRVRRSEAVIAVLPGDSEPYRLLYVLDEEPHSS